MVKTKACDRDRAISRAKHEVHKIHNDINHVRLWINSRLASYSEPKYGVELFVCEGSPTRGYVVAQVDENCGTATAFDWHDEILARIEWGHGG